MGLREQQQLLVRLYTDTSLRESFYQSPDDVGVSFGLTPQEVEQLLQLPTSQLDQFANSLQAKRIGQIRKLLPLTCEQLPSTRLWLRAFAPTYTPTNPKIHHDDAIAFARFLTTQQDSHPRDLSCPVWLGDLARYEAAWLECQRPTFRWMVRLFHYPVHHIRRDLTNESFQAPTPRRSLGIWLRLTSEHPLRHWMI
ncbi:MAG: hypothetical protein EP343_26760 [Deltaproteobacteria bacterium]|nr:MAG: hypothetical protein EP343_26760 [Deltaproteobacteria bacterium]